MKLIILGYHQRILFQIVPPFAIQGIIGDSKLTDNEIATQAQLKQLFYVHIRDAGEVAKLDHHLI